MRVIIFFAYLCFLLLSGNQYAFTNTHLYNLRYTSLEDIENKQQVKSTDAVPVDPVLTVSGPDTDEEFVITDDIDDEDASNFLFRKYKVLARSYLSLPPPFVLSALHKCLKSSPPFGAHLSYRYLTQRVLRI